MAFIEECLIVLCYSTRTQFALLIGLVFFIGCLLFGHYEAATFHLDGLFAPIGESIRPWIEYLYAKIAWAGLIGIWLQAVKVFIKDRKRLLDM